MSYAETLTPLQRKKYEKHAIGSTLFGCISEQMIDSNALLVLYIVSLGGNDSSSMFSTSLSYIGSLLLIPSAGLAVRFGLRVTYSFACIVGCLALLGMALAPYAGDMAQKIVLIGCFVYSLTRPIYSSTWYPLLDNFLLPDTRGKFFGKMRFTYMVLNACLLYLLGKILGANPSLFLMQCIFAFGGITLLGRKFEMDRLPLNPDAVYEKIHTRQALGICIRNGPLVGFSLYSCLVNICYHAMLPLGIVYMKTYLKIDAESLMTYTTINLVGMICGYAMINRAIQKFTTKRCLIATHCIGIAVSLLFLFATPENPLTRYLFYPAVLLNGIGCAFMLCINSIEMLALAKPGNKVMAMAFCATLTSLGSAVGRLGTTLILGSGALAASWKLGGATLSKFQFLFGFYSFTLIFFLILLPLAPAVVPKHRDYYHP